MSIYREVDSGGECQGWRFCADDLTTDVGTWARTVAERVDRDVIRLYTDSDPRGWIEAYAGDVILRDGPTSDSLTLAVNPYAWEEV